MITIERQIECIRREVNMRRRVYPRWVAAGKMSQAKAAEEIEVMEAVQAHLGSIQAGQRLI